MNAHLAKKAEKFMRVCGQAGIVARFFFSAKFGTTWTRVFPLALSLAASFLNLASFALLALFVHAVSDLSLFSKLSPTVKVGILAAGFLATFCAAVLTQFYADRAVARSAVLMEKFAARGLASTSDVSTTGVGPAQGPHYLGHVLISAYHAAVPAIGSVLAMCVMLYLRPFLTLAVLVAVVIVAPLYMLMAERGARSKDIVQHATGRTNAKVASIADLAWNEDYSAEVPNSQSDEDLGAYERRLVASYKTNLVGGLALGIVASMMVFGFGLEIIQGRFVPSIAIFYLVLLGQFWLGVKGAGWFVAHVDMVGRHIDPAISQLTDYDTDGSPRGH